MKRISVFCSLWGDKYSTDYVDKLYSMVERHCPIPFDFYCQTDKTGFRYEVKRLPFLTDLPESTPNEMWASKDFVYGLPRLWDRPKLNYWKPNGWDISGTKIAFDVDVIIQNDMTPIIEMFKDKPLTLRSWWHDMDHEALPDWRRRYGARNNGGFFMWNDEQMAPVWEDLKENWERIYWCFTGGSDNYLTTRHFDRFDLIPPSMSYSFNRGCEWPHDIEMWKQREDKIICVFNTDVGNPLHQEIHEAAEVWPWVKEYWQ